MNTQHGHSDSEAIRALARQIAERRTGMAAYLVDDETWAAALEEAKATYDLETRAARMEQEIRLLAGPPPSADDHAPDA